MGREFESRRQLQRLQGYPGGVLGKYLKAMGMVAHTNQ